MLLEIESRVRIILVEPSHPGNIGAVARAMKTMGLRRLTLVRPKLFPSPEATARAAGADDLLHDVTVCNDLDVSLEGCIWVLGTTARERHIQWPQIESHSLAATVCEKVRRGDVAIVFGRESSGLRNDELDRCHAVFRIPANEYFGSLNLASSVQIVGYELRMYGLTKEEGVPTSASSMAVTTQEMEGFYAHLRRVLIDLDYLDEEKPKLLMRRLRRLFNRANPDRPELNILRGILAAVESALGKK